MADIACGYYDQIQTLHQTFPHISLTSIAYSLSKTRSVERTGEEILEKGFLPEVSQCSSIYDAEVGLLLTLFRRL
jgi:hypothetical protein